MNISFCKLGTHFFLTSYPLAKPGGPGGPGSPGAPSLPALPSLPPSPFWPCTMLCSALHTIDDNHEESLTCMPSGPRGPLSPCFPSSPFDPTSPRPPEDPRGPWSKTFQAEERMIYSLPGVLLSPAGQACPPHHDRPWEAPSPSPSLSVGFGFEDHDIGDDWCGCGKFLRGWQPHLLHHGLIAATLADHNLSLNKKSWASISQICKRSVPTTTRSAGKTCLKTPPD